MRQEILFNDKLYNLYSLSDKLRALVREPAIPTERPTLGGEVSANFCG
jgi:hypothetical protein